MSTFKAKIRGVAPGIILQSNLPMLYPDNEKVAELRELSQMGTKKRTVEIGERMARLEWELGLHLNDKNEPILPREMLESTIIEGAKCSREGMKAKAGMMVVSDGILQHSGPTDSLDKLYEYKDGSEFPIFVYRAVVRVQRNRVVRTRPIFPEWEVEVEGTINDEIANPKDIEKWIRDAGVQKGLGNRRPQWGRFELVEFKSSK